MFRENATETSVDRVEEMVRHRVPRASGPSASNPVYTVLQQLPVCA